MAEHPHATVVRKGYEAFSRGDMDTLRTLMTGDATHHLPGDHPLAGDYKGQDACIELYQRLFEETGGTLNVELRQLFVDARGHVMSVHHATAERQGKHLEIDGGIVFRVVGDKASDLDECVADLDQFNDFWS